MFHLQIRRLITIFLATLWALPGGGAEIADSGRGSLVSPLEALFSRRAGQDLLLYGRSLFIGVGAGSASLPAGAVADDYRLGPGDELVLHLRGQVSRSSRHPIGPDGLLVIDDLRPLQAAGQTLGSVRAAVEEAVAAAHLQTHSFLSIGRTRQISVLVLGAVAQPGRQQLNGFATVLDALTAAGGIGPGGSLRAVRLVRPGEAPVTVDLYQLLEQGDGPATELPGDGARLIVPPLGSTVAIAGSVKRPGIYELPVDGVMMADTLLALAGGSLRPGGERTSLLRYGGDGVERTQPLPSPDMLALQDGDLLLQAPDGGARMGDFTLSGHVETPGPRPLYRDASLAEFLSEDAAPADLYRPLAVLLRRPVAGGPAEMLAIAPSALLAGTDRAPARDGDELVLLGADDIAYLRARPVLALLGATAITPPQTDCPGLQSLAAALAADPDGPLAAGPVALAARHMTGPDRTCPPLFREKPDLLPFLLRQSVLLRRGALRPGPYPVLGGTPLAMLAPLAGASMTGPDQRLLAPGQLVDIEGDGVLLSGPVRQPGLRPVSQAGSLRALLMPDGALLPEAYGLAALLERSDGDGLSARTLLFAPADIIAGRFDQRLRDGDRITILSRAQIQAAFAPPPAGPDGDVAPLPAAAPTLPALPPPLRALLAERIIGVRGGVAAPGDYPVAGPMPVAMLLRAAGGLRAEADPARVELIPADSEATAPSLLPGGVATTHEAAPGDSIRVALRRRPAEPRSMQLAGEVMEPGSFDLAAGEKLSALLARAGGVTPHAYPAGAIFTRQSARAAEEEGLRRAARELDRELAQMLGGKNPPDPQRVALVRQLADELRNTQGLGRITVQVDPEILAQRPELDIMLQAGDRLYIPKRPLTVTVAGEVLSPASLLFDPEKDAADYLREAGGLTRFADDDRIFLIHPDGSAEPLDQPRGRHGRVAVTPGAMLVVPRDAEPLEILPLAQSITTILSQIAFTAAAIASIED